MIMRKNLMVVALAGLVAGGCMDLEVRNPLDPDRERALRTPGDIEALVGGAYRNWYNTNVSSAGAGPILATLAYQHSATAANFGMVEFSSWPKSRVHHVEADNYYGQFAYSWTQLYRAVSSVVDGLKTLDGGDVTLPASQLARIQAFGYFVLGLAHGSAALMYDQGYIYDPSIEIDDVDLHPYTDVLNAAFGYFDRAIQEAANMTAADPIPELWMAREVTGPQLIRLARSYKARYRAAVARTPAERAAVNWAQVISDVDAGITEDFTWNTRVGTGWTLSAPLNIFRYGAWGQLSYQVMGMADQSGSYQQWISRDPWDRHPNLSPDQSGDPFLIITPDLRFPRGNSIVEQCNRQVTGTSCSTAGSPPLKDPDERGRVFELTADGGGVGGQWNRPDRGPFRWSYYRPWIYDDWASPRTTRTDWPEMKVREMRLLKAEALFRQGDLAGAAAIVNETRVPAGLNATDASGTNTSCVPKLPNGSCGDLFEMLKWESRLETIYSGLHLAPWYFNGRGWGDLAEGSFLHFPVPGREMQLLLRPEYTFGGSGNEGSAPVGTYGY